MDKYFEPFPDNLLRWDLVHDLEELTKDDKTNSDEHSNEQFLQRNYFSLYGKLPFIEKRTYSVCNQCEQVFNPKSINIHKKNCTKKGTKPIQSLISKKKVKSKKKLLINRNISPTQSSQPQSVFTTTDETRSTITSTITTTATTNIITTCTTITTTTSSSSNSNNSNSSSSSSSSSNLSSNTIPNLLETTVTTDNLIIPTTIDEIQTKSSDCLTTDLKEHSNYFPSYDNTKNDSTTKRSNNYFVCNNCEQVFDSKTIHLHKKNCTKKNHIIKSTLNNLLKKNVKNKKKNNLLRNVPPPPLFNEIPSSTITRLADTSSTNTMPVTEKNVQTSTLIPIPQLDEIKDNIKLDLSENNLINKNIDNQIELSTTSSSLLTTNDSPCSNNNSNRGSINKKIKKTKEYDPDIHCGVIEGVKGPCTRSITCSNHKLHLRKLVPGRSKDINQLIAERKQSIKDKDREQQINEIKTNNNDNKNCVIRPDDDNKLLTKDADLLENFTSFISSDNASFVTLDVDNSVGDNDVDNEIDPLQNQDNNDPIIYKPMSPVSVVSPVQTKVKKENTIYSEIPQPATSPIVHNGSLFLCIPDPVSNLKLYKTHPKPATLPTYGTRKVGGSLVLSNQRLDWQQNEIEKAILLSDNNKQSIRLTQDINGYILHADMSEAAEAPQHNHSIQENINLLNMK